MRSPSVRIALHSTALSVLVSSLFVAPNALGQAGSAVNGLALDYAYRGRLDSEGARTLLIFEKAGRTPVIVSVGSELDGGLRVESIGADSIAVVLASGQRTTVWLGQMKGVSAAAASQQALGDIYAAQPAGALGDSGSGELPAALPPGGRMRLRH